MDLHKNQDEELAFFSFWKMKEAFLQRKVLLLFVTWNLFDVADPNV